MDWEMQSLDIYLHIGLGRSATTRCPLVQRLTVVALQRQDATNGTVTFVGPDLKCQLTCTVGSDKACAPVLANIVKTVGSKGDAQVRGQPPT
jgi:hypothetical protein